MYSRVLTHEDAAELYRQECNRLLDNKLGDRRRVVIRIFASRESREQIGMEYGAILYRDPRDGQLRARVQMDSTGRRKLIPLDVRIDGILMSQELKPRGKQGVKIGLQLFVHEAIDGQPSRPIGYVLPEEYAARPIMDESDELYLIAA